MNIDAQDRIKRRIRSLLSLAADDAAATGEIDNAMRMAAALMDEHHLSEAELGASASSPKDEPIGAKMAPAVGAKWSTWESVLSSAVETLVGSVKCYRTSGTFAEETFRREVHKPAIRYYGPEADATLAADIFSDWAHVIATMAAARYGGCFRGDGAKYAYGFACTLQECAKVADQSCAAITSDSISTLVHVPSANLSTLLASKRRAASAWLNSQGVKLSSGGSRAGYRAGSHDAYTAGRSDGARADFTATRQRRLA